MVKSYQIVLTAVPQQLSIAAFGTNDEQQNIPFRQLVFTADGNAYVGDASVSIVSGIVAVPSLTLGPYETGPIKLSDFWAVGPGATLHILGVPF